jgi:hypothetical protein
MLKFGYTPLTPKPERFDVRRYGSYRLLDLES